MIFIRFTYFLRFVVSEFQCTSFVLFLCFYSLIFIYFRGSRKLTIFRSQIFKVILLVFITQATKSPRKITNVISFHDLQVFLCKQIFYLTLIILQSSVALSSMESEFFGCHNFFVNMVALFFNLLSFLNTSTLALPTLEIQATINVKTH